MSKRAPTAEKQMRDATKLDTERAHAEADDILVRLLRRLGYKDLCDLYERVGKWYA